MEINIKAIAGDYAWISEFHTLWKTSYPSRIKNKEKENLFRYAEIIDKMLEGVQTKYIDVKEAEELEKSAENGTRSTKRTKQIENAIENIKEILSEDRYKELKRAFKRYEKYVNYDKEIVLRKSDKLEGCWEITDKNKDKENINIEELKEGDYVLVKCKVEAVFVNSGMVCVSTRDCEKGFDVYTDEIIGKENED